MSRARSGAACCLAALLLLGFGPARAASGSDPGDEEIFIARRGWHVDVGFAAASLEPPLDALAAPFPGIRYAFFGFGDRRYLLSARHGVPSMLSALWPGRGLILETALRAPPADAFGALHVVRLRLSPARLAAAQAFVWRSLGDAGAGPDAGRAAVIAPGPYPGSVYHASSARYSAAHTCNTWVAEVLGAAGFPVRSAGVVFAGQVWRQAKKLAAAADAAAAAADPTGRAAASRPGTPPSSRNVAGPPRSCSSRGAEDCCC